IVIGFFIVRRQRRTVLEIRMLRRLRRRGIRPVLVFRSLMELLGCGEVRLAPVVGLRWWLVFALGIGPSVVSVIVRTLARRRQVRLASWLPFSRGAGGRAARRLLPPPRVFVGARRRWRRGCRPAPGAELRGRW